MYIQQNNAFWGISILLVFDTEQPFDGAYLRYFVWDGNFEIQLKRLREDSTKGTAARNTVSARVNEGLKKLQSKRDRAWKS